MKHRKLYNKVILSLGVVLAGLFTSCSAVDDFLTVYPTNQITSETFWEDKGDLNSVLYSCYRQLTLPVPISGHPTTVQQMFAWGELRSDNFLLTSESDENLKNIMNANLLPTNWWFDWSWFYTGIAYCNLCLQKGEETIKIDASFSENDWKPIEAELKALRALYYFYLVRAFRDVPFTTEANDTSEGATDPVPQTPSEEILSFLINDLEAVKDNGMINYGSDDLNKARFTRNGIYALLCDIYLWRASKNSSPDSIAKYPGEAEADYRKVIEYADFLKDDLISQFREKKQDYYGSDRSPFKGEDVVPLPLYTTDKSRRVQDIPYNTIFGDKYSLEGLFEIAFDGDVNKNNAFTKFLGEGNNNRVSPGALSAAAAFQSISGKPDDATVAYSKTDLRYYENIEKTAGSSTSAVFNIAKYSCEMVTTDGANDITNSGTTINYQNWRSSSNFDANYVVYRISDILLMKAEAIACLQEYILKSDDEEMLREGFQMVKGVFARSNPMIESADDLTFEIYNSAQALEELVMRERQRELFAEGKRWFDLVRYAMRQGNTNKMLNLLVIKYSTNSSAIKAKLATLNSLYNPVYQEEIKINTALVQNPAWITDETIVKN
ncbi:MAG: RagB/SusD family nutrient uptake outer membrane protein [Bacteroidaceae bacterium]|nr:RagB/SusD family nutrient uptake outer membrane protein [Bacteroidaceae bacterium]